MEKECTKCHEVKPLDQYCKSSRGKMGVQPACKACMNVAYTKARKKKQQHYQDVSRQRTTALAQQITDYKADHPCVVCGEDDPCCIDFHHVDPSTKDVEVSNMRHLSWERVLTEVAKCVTLCRNCHAKVHAGKITL
jgi:hypothetical protein